jgi:hypothetical protein
MQPRRLDFHSFDEALAEVDRLHRGGYEKAGQWDLAQTCDHLTYFMKSSLDGATFRVPWLLKVLFGRWVLRRVLKTRRMRAGVTTPQKPLPEPGGDEAVAVGKFKQTVERLRSHPGELHPSPFFGRLTPAEWRELHLIHAAHHLGYLLPKSAVGSDTVQQ